MLFPIYFLMGQQDSNVSLTVDGSTLLWGLISMLVVVIGFFIVRYLNNTDKALHELEWKVDRGFERFDNRLDNFERNQVRIMVKLGIDD